MRFAVLTIGAILASRLLTCLPSRPTAAPLTAPAGPCPERSNNAESDASGRNIDEQETLKNREPANRTAKASVWMP